MSFVDAIVRYYGLDPATATPQGLQADADGLTLMVTLRVPNAEIGAIVDEMDAVDQG